MPVPTSTPPSAHAGAQLSRPHPGAGRLRPQLGHRLALFWFAAVALAAASGVTVAHFLAQAQAGAQRWGALRPTLVATADLPRGAVLGPGDVEIHQRPAAHLPAGALDSPVEGQTVAHAIHRGEVVLADRLAPEGLSPTAAALPPGRLGIAVPTGPAALPLEPGDVVEVLVTVDPGAAGAGEPTFPVARGAEVVGVGEESVTLAVGAEEAPRVAFALTTGVVTLVLSAGR